MSINLVFCANFQREEGQTATCLVGRNNCQECYSKERFNLHKQTHEQLQKQFQEETLKSSTYYEALKELWENHIEESDECHIPCDQCAGINNGCKLQKARKIFSK